MRTLYFLIFIFISSNSYGFSFQDLLESVGLGETKELGGVSGEELDKNLNQKSSDIPSNIESIDGGVADNWNCDLKKPHKYAEAVPKPDKGPIFRGTSAWDLGDYENAFKNYCVATTIRDRSPVNLTFLDAQYRVGVMYMSGLGVKEDINIAVKWFELLSVEDEEKEVVADAKYWLGVVYSLGDGRPVDLKKARAYFEGANVFDDHVAAQEQLKKLAYTEIGEKIPDVEAKTEPTTAKSTCDLKNKLAYIPAC